MRQLSLEDKIYICKYHDIDKDICYSMDLSKKDIAEALEEMKENGVYDIYRKMPDEEYEKMINEEKNRNKKGLSNKVGLTQIIGTVEDSYVKVPVKTVAEWAYYKGYLDRMLEEVE